MYDVIVVGARCPRDPRPAALNKVRLDAAAEAGAEPRAGLALGEYQQRHEARRFSLAYELLTPPESFFNPSHVQRVLAGRAP